MLDQPVVQYVGVLDSDDLCSTCRTAVNRARADPIVTVVDIAQVDSGWLARGEMSVTFCQQCGAAYEVLARYIPIECAGFPCPACGPGSQLTPQILSISRTQSGYDFTATLRCAGCTSQRRLQKILQAFSRITRVKIGPAGIEVEVGS